MISFGGHEIYGDVCEVVGEAVEKEGVIQPGG